MSVSEGFERVVIRFNPFGVESLRNSVRKQALGDLAKARPVKYGVSVFGDVIRDDEDMDSAADRLCSEITHNVAGGDRMTVTTETRLRERGYALHEAVPPEKHYLVGGSDLAIEPDLDSLAEEFQDRRRNNPAFKER
ncbi:hypothetical protein ACI3KS_05060 [Microbacterium sp. ZW T5_45]|uniref:hypothetical protein n=1 Tax=Microbacterium sp. ZW T5_45 TaxID=3378080 RepID=UPI003854E947